MSVLQDRRRVLPPVDTVPLSLPKSTVKTESPRKHDQIRKLFVKSGIVANANGSAYIEVGNIRLQCSIYGPKPIRGSFTERADVTVEAKISGVVQTNDDEGTSLERDIASFVHTSITPSIILSQYPKSAISLVLTVISADLASNNHKSILAAATNVASLALADARIALHDMVTAGAVLLDRTQAQPIVIHDPGLPLARDSDQAEAVLSFLTARQNQLVGLWADGGHISGDELQALSSECQSIGVQVRALLNGVLIEAFRRRETEASSGAI